MKLYYFHWDCGRQGDLDGIFVVSEEGEKILRALIGMEIDFGEALGKHSQIVGTLEASELEAVEATDEEILTVCRVLRIPFDGARWATISGHNPLDYIGNTGIDFEALLVKAGLPPDTATAPAPDEF